MSKKMRSQTSNSFGPFYVEDQIRKQPVRTNMFVMEQYPRAYPTNKPETYQDTVSFWRILADIISLIILLVVTIIAHFVAKPFDRGFFCSDTTIKYPYKSNTIPTYAAVLLSIGLPMLGMYATEICKLCYFRIYPKRPFVTQLQICGGSFKIPAWLRNLYILTIVFFYGYLATWLLTEMAKNFVGELRPHFLAQCQPSVNCSTLTSLYDFNRLLQYGSDYTCRNTNEDDVREARRSFFSGHASSMFYGLAWLIMYIHVAWSWTHLGIITHLIQVGLAVLAAYVGYTRLTDYHHHWQDVLFGAIIGSLIAFFTFKFILNWYRRNLQFLPHIVSSSATSLLTNNRRTNLNPGFQYS